MLFVPLAFYVMFCILTGYYGRTRRLGFLPTVILALLFTPACVAVVLYFCAGPDCRPTNGAPPARTGLR